MASFNLFNRLQTWFGDEGQLLAGGYFKFYDAGTSTPADMFSDSALATNIGATVDLDASGRLLHECWGDASDTYFVELYDAEDVKQADFDDVGVPGGPAQVIPIPDEDEYLGGDGTVLIAKTYTGLPDPTGQASKILSTDGTDFIWIAKPSNGADGVSDLDAVGLTGKTIRSGAATGTSAGGRTQDVSVTYGTALGAAADCIAIEITSASLSSGGTMPSWSFPSSSASGFTVRFTMGEIDDTRSDFDFNAGVAFKYFAIGDEP